MIRYSFYQLSAAVENIPPHDFELNGKKRKNDLLRFKLPISKRSRKSVFYKKEKPRIDNKQADRQLLEKLKKKQAQIAHFKNRE